MKKISRRNLIKTGMLGFSALSAGGIWLPDSAEAQMAPFAYFKNPQPSFNAGAIATAAAATSITIAYPSVVKAGDRLLVVGWKDGSRGYVLTTAGWTFGQAETQSSSYLMYYHKVAAGTETGSVTFNFTVGGAANYLTAQMFAIRNTQYQTPREIDQGFASSHSTQPFSYVSNGRNLTLIIVTDTTSFTVSTAPTGYTLQSSRTTTPAFHSYYAWNSPNAVTISTSINSSLRALNIN